MLAVNTSLRALDLSGFRPNDGASSGAAFAQALAVGLGSNMALASLNMSSNATGALVLGGSWQCRWDEGGDCAGFVHSDGRIAKEHPGRPGGVIALAHSIASNGTIISLDISHNNLGAHTQYIAAAILKCQSLSCLDISRNNSSQVADASITAAAKQQAIRWQRACACLIGVTNIELNTKAVRALLVATNNFQSPMGWLKKAAMYL